MRRMLLYALAVLVSLLTGVLALGIPEAGLAFASLGIALIWGLCWGARRFPAMQRLHFRAAALLALASAITLAVALPSMSTCRGAPAKSPPGIHDAPGGGCAIDRLMTIRLAIFAAGVAAAWVLTVARRRAGTAPPNPVRVGVDGAGRFGR